MTEPRYRQGSPRTESRRGDAGAAPAPATRYREAPAALYDQGDDGHVDDGYGAFFGSPESSGKYVRIPRRAPEPPRFIGPSLLVKLAVLVALLLTVRWGYHVVNPAGDPGAVVVVEIPLGSTIAEVAEVLADAGVVGNARLFQEYARLKGGSVLNAGSFTLRKSMALWEALEVLKAGPKPVGYANLTVPEGLRLTQLAESVADSLQRFSVESITAALGSGKIPSAYLPPSGSLEGLLFPDTYQVADDSDEVAVLSKMAAQLETVAAEIKLDERAAALGLTPYQIITIASMIEEEAKVPEERAKIARVIYNRLAEDMPLGIDATTLYGFGKEGNTLTVAELNSDSPYNTRRVPGLPPGPISAPGRASLEAALKPAAGPWLYYVLKDSDGRHAFTDDADTFDELVAVAEAKGLLG